MARKYNSLGEVPPHIIEKLGKYVTNVGDTTFAIHNLPPELTGGVLARYSRASTGLQLTLVNEFLDDNGDPCEEKGSELMDRVLNQFGDDSVGELEGIHVGIEDISQLTTKEIEDRRIGGSPIEQSTRYVKYDVKDKEDRWRYLRPKEIKESGLLSLFEEVNNKSFEVYSEGIKRLTNLFQKQFTRDRFSIDGEREGKKIKIYESSIQTDEEKRAFNNGYNFTIRCAALDIGRCILPTSTLTHIGLFGNGRSFSHLLSHLKSTSLDEFQTRAKNLETELNKVIPTFIKRNRANPQKIEINKKMRDISYKLFKDINPEAQRVSLMPKYDLLDEVIASSLFPYTNLSLPQIMKAVTELPLNKKIEINSVYKGNRITRRDRTGRGLEAGYPLTFDLVGGFAEYRDLERHRMLTQQRQNLTPDLGFIVPPEMIEVGLEKEVNNLVSQMGDLNSEIRHAGLYEVSQYATLFNHRIRFMLGMNLREFQHLSELRTQPSGHFSYRSMVMEMADKVKEMYPWSADFIQFVDYSDPDNKITRAKEQSKISGKNLRCDVDASHDLT